MLLYVNYAVRQVGGWPFPLFPAHAGVVFLLPSRILVPQISQVGQYRGVILSLGIFKRIISGITSIFKGSGSGSPAKGGKEGSPEKSSSERKPRRDRQRGKSVDGQPKAARPSPERPKRGGSSPQGGRGGRRDLPQQGAPVTAVHFDSSEESRLGEERAHSILSKKKLGSWEPPLVENREEGAKYFQDFPLAKEILRAALDDMGFKKCTPIQGLALPVAITGADMAGKAQTGTGKTAVFLMSMLDQFVRNGGGRKLNQPFALALAPTRELAIQIAKDADNLSVYTSLRTVAVYGGMDYERQRRLLQAGCDLIVATPGRLIDFLQKRVIDTSMLKVLIIDEADRMLDMGFIPDVKRIIAHLPSKEERQTMLFSATLSRDIMNLASRWMRPDPTVLEVEPEHVVAEGVNETVYACTTHEKLAIIIWILQHEDVHRALIFRNRRRDVEELCHQLRRYGIQCEMLSGDVSQNRRLNILEAFRNGTVKVVVATDVAGRGIQVDDITHVFNYDLPYEAEDYVHRVGRTARAGHQGRAVSFADEDCAFVMPEIEEYIGRPLAAIQPPEEMLVLPSAPSGPKAHSHRGDSGPHLPSGGRSASRTASGSRSPHGGRPSSRSGSSFHRTGSGAR